MSGKEWLEILEEKLKKLPKDERQKVVDFYTEIISDKIEDGCGGESVVFSLGNPSDIADKICRENGIDCGGQREKENPKRNGKPLWFSITVGFFAVAVGIPVAIALLASWIAVLISIWACFGAFLVGAGACAVGVFASAIMALLGAVQNGWALFGGAIASVGITALLSVGFWYLAIGASKFSLWIISGARGEKV